MTTEGSAEDLTTQKSTIDEFAKDVEALFKSPPKAPFPQFSGDQEVAFEQLNRALDELFGITLWDGLDKLNASQLAAVDTQVTPENEQAWNAVMGTADQVLAYKTTVETVIEGQRVYLDGAQLILQSLSEQTLTYVGLQETDPPPSAPFPLSDLLLTLLSPLSLIPGGVGSAAAGVIRGVIGIAQWAADQGGDGPSPEKVFNDFKLASLKIERQLTQQFNDGLNSLATVLRGALADYGLLRALAKLFDQPSVVWPQEASGLSDEGMKALEVRLWKLFLPTRWPILTVDGPTLKLSVPASNETEAQQAATKLMDSWPQSYWVVTGSHQKEPYTGERWDVTAKTLANSAENGHRADPRLDGDSAKRLFDTLAVPREDVFDQKNGWDNFQTQSIYWPYSRDTEWVFGS